MTSWEAQGLLDEAITRMAEQLEEMVTMMAAFERRLRHVRSYLAEEPP